jgi:hypothetical protein
MMAPRVLIRQLQYFHLELSQALEFEFSQILLHVFDVLHAWRLTHHLLDQDADKLFNLLKVLRLCASGFPQSDESI